MQISNMKWSLKNNSKLIRIKTYQEPEQTCLGIYVKIDQQLGLSIYKSEFKTNDQNKQPIV